MIFSAKGSPSEYVNSTPNQTCISAITGVVINVIVPNAVHLRLKWSPGWRQQDRGIVSYTKQGKNQSMQIVYAKGTYKLCMAD